MQTVALRIQVLRQQVERMIQRRVRGMTVLVLVRGVMVVIVIVTMQDNGRLVPGGVLQREMTPGPKMLFMCQVKRHVEQANSERHEQQKTD